LICAEYNQLSWKHFRVETEKETAGKADKPYQATKLKNTKNEE